MIVLLAPATSALGAEAPGAMSGEVSASHSPLAGIEVCAFSTNIEVFSEEEAKGHFGCAKTGANGEYTVSELDPESYYVEFRAPEESKLDYIPQYYDDKSLPSEAETVPVAAEKTTPGIDAELSPGAEINGTVTDAETGAPIEKAVVCAVQTVPGGDIECALSEADGEYSLRGLQSGAYKLLFGAKGFEFQYYNDKSSAAEAEAVSISAPALTKGIDAALKPAGSTAPPPGSQPAAGSLGTSLAGGLTTSSSSSAETTLLLARKRIAVARNGDALVKVDCAGATSCLAKLKLEVKRTVRIEGKRKLRTITIGTAIISITAGKKATAKIKLDAAGRGLLSAARGPLAVELVLVIHRHDQDEHVVLVKQEARVTASRATS